MDVFFFSKHYVKELLSERHFLSLDRRGEAKQVAAYRWSGKPLYILLDFIKILNNTST